MEEGTYLTKFASKVTIVHRRDEFRASKIMLKRAQDNDKIDFVVNATVRGNFTGRRRVGRTRSTAQGHPNGSDARIPLRGRLYGHRPHTQLPAFRRRIGHERAGLPSSPTRIRPPLGIPGVFACGDVQDSVYRQAVTAAGTGCMAAIEAERFLAH